ncbi:hypothetical protein GCM10008013_03570 [Paenibacillus segetis]|uniref:Uncharacterized protein n=1 Tax=Paenibacillus segetis TaxID=1325360 RepID=A0ABQ1Y4R9_9BACL|nr:hypothetical protein GCM10008013_03570 [Paenibacillus segetis]
MVVKGDKLPSGKPTILLICGLCGLYKNATPLLTGFIINRVTPNTVYRKMGGIIIYAKDFQISQTPRMVDGII